MKKLQFLQETKRLKGISDIRDESNREGIRIVLELRRGLSQKLLDDNFIN